MAYIIMWLLGLPLGLVSNSFIPWQTVGRRQEWAVTSYTDSDRTRDSGKLYIQSMALPLPLSG